MDETIIDGNCGELCGFHCCRSHSASGEKLGMYLYPMEFECLQNKDSIEYEIHTSYAYDLPKGIKKMVYIFCPDDSTCLRGKRPIQCRTYPFEPHIESGELFLVIEKKQLHLCPVIDVKSKWRKAFVEGVYNAWSLLIQIEGVKKYIEGQSEERLRCNNIDTKWNSDYIEKIF